MALFGSFASRFARPAGKVLDAPIREIVFEVLREHGYASPAEVEALRDELRSLTARVDGLGRAVDQLTAVAETARAEAAAARGEADAARAATAAAVAPLDARVADLSAALSAAQAAPKADDPRVAALEARVAELSVALSAAHAPVSAAPAPEPEPEPEEASAPRAGCKVGGCPDTVRSKGFCSAHYQQWRRGTLRGFVTAEATILVGERIVHLPKDTIGEPVALDGERVLVNGVEVGS